MRTSEVDEGSLTPLTFKERGEADEEDIDFVALSSHFLRELIHQTMNLEY
jgi:hypothetical protein